jgi:diadenosine tetraphosphate (Ap4A) HIT family hydrolase
VPVRNDTNRGPEELKQVVPTERLYIFSLGSQQGNKHVHWHIAPLPPGIPYEGQQLNALKIENGILEISDEDMAWLVNLIRSAME